MKKARDTVKAEFGGCDILLNGAGGNNPRGTTSGEYMQKEDIKPREGFTSFFDLDPKGVEFVFNLNFLGTLLPTQAFAKDMLEKEGGVIIKYIVNERVYALTKIPAYSGAKAAISNFTQWLAVHMSKVGIRVNAIAPGFLVTDQNRTLLKNPDGSLTDRSKKILGQTPMGRFGETEELVGTLLWLVDNKASGFVNGVVVPVDGGFNAYSGV